MPTVNYRAGSAAALDTLGIGHFNKVAVSPEWIKQRITNAVQKGVTNKRMREFENSVFTIADRSAAKRSLNIGDPTRAALLHDKATDAGLEARRQQMAHTSNNAMGAKHPPMLDDTLNIQLPRSAPLPLGYWPEALAAGGVGAVVGSHYYNRSKDKPAAAEPSPMPPQAV
jgi:hypothetical protein